MQSEDLLPPINPWGKSIGKPRKVPQADPVVGETICGLSVHPAANVFPMLEGDDLRAMLESIHINGQRMPVIGDGDTLLEGRNRARRVLREIFKAEEAAEKANGEKEVSND